MSCFPTGVCVVTLGGPEPIGVTISSLVSLSLDPLLILFCLGSHTHTHKAFMKAATEKKAWGLTLLAKGQEDISNRFTHHDPHHWSHTSLLTQNTPEAPPHITGGVAYLTGVIDHTLAGGDHTIFVGNVKDCLDHTDQAPLVYLHSGYSG